MVHSTPIGTTNFRNEHKNFSITDTDRMGHIYVIGKTGVGKSTLLLNMAISDIEQGKGLCVIDPHGDLAETILNHVPAHRIEDVVYINPQDTTIPIAFNPLHAVHPGEYHLVASGLIATFRKIWSESWGPRLEYILRMALLTLLEYPHATLLDIQPILTDEYFRNKALMYCTNQAIHAFWTHEFDKYSPALKAEAIAPVLNKTGIFITSIPLRNMVGQRVSSFNIAQCMNTGKIVIANLSKGAIGEEASSILGSMLVTSIQLSALQRSRIPEDQRRPFYLYVDEMQSFVSLSFADILAEARKYKLGLFLTHQYIEQLSEAIRAAIFGNVGTFISFRVGAADAKVVAREFEPVFSEADVIALPKYHVYLKLMIDGATSQPFSAVTHSLPTVTRSFKQEVIEYSRKNYGRRYQATLREETKPPEPVPPTLFDE